MPVFSKSVWIGVPPGKAYSFHLHPSNIRLVQPPLPPVAEISGPETLAAGDLLEIKLLTPLGIQLWRVEVETADGPHGNPVHALLVDRALKGPFAFWRHRHIFSGNNNGTLMTDCLDYDPPGGITGLLLFPIFQSMFWLVFQYRHIKTKKLLENS